MNINALLAGRLNNIAATETPKLRLFGAVGTDFRAAPSNRSIDVPTTVKNIVVPLDGSAFAEHAIPWALGIAEQSGALVHLVHVLIPIDEIDPYDALHFPEASLSRIKRNRKQYLADTIARISKSTSVFVSARTLIGRSAPQSLLEIDGFGADLIVMATHGRGALGRLWRGSVTHTTLRNTSIPLVAVRGKDEAVALEPKPVANVLLPLDGSRESETALKSIVDLNAFPAARHTLLRVVPLEARYLIERSMLRMELVPARQSSAAAIEYLRPFAASLRDRVRQVHTKVVSSDEAIAGIVNRYVEQASCALVGVAYVRQDSLTRLLRPNTSEALFQTASCPLMLFPVNR